MSSSESTPARVTVPEIKTRKPSAGHGLPLVMLTAYDVASSRLADRAGADIILVGDSAGMVVLGRENTLSVTMDEMVLLSRAVAAARPRALVVGDMPYLSYHLSLEEAVRNAGRFLSEGGCQAVKIEGGGKRLKVIRALLDAEIPVMGHLGLTPQSVHRMGGFRVQAKRAEAAETLVGEAEALAEAGVFSIVLEGIPEEVARLVTRAVRVPTIGIGAGPHCDGQVLVYHDLLGLTEGPVPKFVRRYAEIGAATVEALARFAADVRSGRFPSREESYHLPAGEAAALDERQGGTGSRAGGEKDAGRDLGGGGQGRPRTPASVRRIR